MLSWRHAPSWAGESSCVSPPSSSCPGPWRRVSGPRCAWVTSGASSPGRTLAEVSWCIPCSRRPLWRPAAVRCFVFLSLVAVLERIVCSAKKTHSAVVLLFCRCAIIFYFGPMWSRLNDSSWHLFKDNVEWIYLFIFKFIYVDLVFWWSNVPHT